MFHVLYSLCLIYSFNNLKDFKLSYGLVLDKLEYIIFSVLSTKFSYKTWTGFMELLCGDTEKWIVAGRFRLGKIRIGSTPKSVVILPLFLFRCVLALSFWSWSAKWASELEQRELQEKSSSSAWGVIKVERKGFPFFPPFACIQAPSSSRTSSTIIATGAKHLTGEPSASISGAVDTRGGSTYMLLFFSFCSVLLGGWGRQSPKLTRGGPKTETQGNRKYQKWHSGLRAWESDPLKMFMYSWSYLWADMHRSDFSLFYQNWKLNR